MNGDDESPLLIPFTLQYYYRRCIRQYAKLERFQFNFSNLNRAKQAIVTIFPSGISPWLPDGLFIVSKALCPLIAPSLRAP